GGKSSRMNYNNKALLSYKEACFIEYIINAGRDFDEIIIIGNDKKAYEKYNLKIVEDIFKDKGPLGGIHSALINSKYNKVLCIACDMPLVKYEVLNQIGNLNYENDVIVPKVLKKIQPLCTIYSKKLIKDIEIKLSENKNKLQTFILEQDYKIIDIDFDEESFININTQEEYIQLNSKNIIVTK
ncbi:MAG: molybdenum cofactor guanylyltransferase, partial [Paraclostridium sp.]